MKKTLLFLAAILLVAEGYSQATFNTGAIEVDVNAYGRIRLFTPDAIRHLQRASLLVGTSSTSVFDYTNDSEELDPTVLVENPLESDFEIYGAYDNTYSNLPPSVIVKLNAYGWTNGSYTVVKFNIENNEENAINARIGLDIIPELNQEYGFDAVTYNTEAGVIRFHRGEQVNMGIKLLSHPLTSLYSFEWYDEYQVDEDYWNWMNYEMLQPEYISNTADGPVTISSQDGIDLNNGQSVDVYYALALGADEATMLSNMTAAVDKYQTMITSVDDNFAVGKELMLEQNSPNPFNASTAIGYELPENGFVSLKVYDATGREVADLVNMNQTAGKYMVELNGINLTEGMYFCTLAMKGQVKTMKIVKGK